MGGTVSKDEHLNLENWIETDDPKSALFPHVNIHRNRLLLNTLTQKYIEEYNLQFASHDDFQ